MKPFFFRLIDLDLRIWYYTFMAWYYRQRVKIARLRVALLQWIIAKRRGER